MKWIVYLLLFCTQQAFGQSGLLKEGEQTVFSFKTKNNKEVVIARSKNNTYLVYRYGNAGKVELEYPANKEASGWNNFFYSYYLRGGGVENEGMELNYLYFINGDYKYVIYDTYFSIDNKYDVGVKVINIKTKKVVAVEGDISSKKSTLTDFRDKLTVTEGDELFD
jgi:hypothetical protein